MISTCVFRLTRAGCISYGRGLGVKRLNTDEAQPFVGLSIAGCSNEGARDQPAEARGEQQVAEASGIGKIGDGPFVLRAHGKVKGAGGSLCRQGALQQTTSPSSLLATVTRVYHKVVAIKLAALALHAVRPASIRRAGGCS